jgi:Na+/phosphate symporter
VSFKLKTRCFEKEVNMAVTGLTQESLNKIEAMCDMASTMMKKVSEGFNQHMKDRLVEAENIYEQVVRLERKTTEQLVKEITEGTDNIELARTYISIPGTFGMIGGNVKTIIENTSKKIEEGVLFSDKAVYELNMLFSKCIELIVCLRDLIATRNEILSGHIINEETKCYNMANEFSTIHEERLISGVCSHQSSTLYLHILGSLKEILLHYKEIALRIQEKGSLTRIDERREAR